MQIRNDSGLEAGVTIGEFRIERRLGVGGMGVVYLARQPSLNRLVALKVLGSALGRPSDIARFQREAQAAALLKHPGIATIHFIGQDQQVCYLAMEYIDGVSVRLVLDYLATSRLANSDIEQAVSVLASGEARPTALRFDVPTEAFSETPTEQPNLGEDGLTPEARALIARPSYIRRSCELVRDAALALAHAHERGVEHQDIKPENLLLDRNGSIHIIDFGLARFFEDVTVTHTGQLVGTPMYMSPEQVTGRTEVDHRADIYSLGLVLYELLSLRRPIQAITRERVLHFIVTKSLPPLSTRNPGVSQALESVAHKATARNPDERYSTAAAFAADVGHALANEPVEALPYRLQDIGREIEDLRPKGFVSNVYVGSTFFAVMSVATSVGMNFRYRSLLSEDFVVRLQFFCMQSLICAFIFAKPLVDARNWARWLTLAFAVESMIIGGYLFVRGISEMLHVDPSRTRRVVIAFACLGAAFIVVILFGCQILKRRCKWPPSRPIRFALALAALVAIGSIYVMIEPSGGRPETPYEFTILRVLGTAFFLAGNVAIWNLLAPSTRDYFRAAKRIRAERRSIATRTPTIKASPNR